MPPTKPVTADETAPSTTPAPLPSKTTTRWDAFEKAKLVPVSVTCDGAKPYHIVNSGCHTKIVAKVDNFLSHLDADHGGGFSVEFRVTDGKPWPGWAELSTRGVELVDFRCDVCGQTIPLHPQHIVKHMGPHSGKMKRAQSTKRFDLTITKELPLISEDDAYSDF